MKRLFTAFFLTVFLLNILPIGPHAAATDKVTTGTISTAEMTEIDLGDAIASDPEGFSLKYSALSQSSALVSLLSTLYAESDVDQEIRKLAATASADYLDLFLANTEGKTFKVSVMNGEIGMSLVEAQSGGFETQDSTQLPKCAKAWAAAFAWYIGTGAICGALTVATFMVAMIGGIACFVGLFTSSMIINWNNSC